MARDYPRNDRVMLRSLDFTDAEQFAAWIRDEEVIKYSLSVFRRLKTSDQVRVWLERVILDTSSFTRGIVRQDTGELIGYTGLADVSSQNRSAEYFIFIGDKSCWHQGFGTEVTRLVVNYGFTELKLNRIQLTASAPNVGAVRLYEQAGFVREGVLRQAAYRGGAYHDRILMSLLRSEWQQ